MLKRFARMLHDEQTAAQKPFLVGKEIFALFQESQSLALLAHCGLPWGDEVHLVLLPAHPAGSTKYDLPTSNAMEGSSNHFSNFAFPFQKKSIGPLLDGYIK